MDVSGGLEKMWENFNTILTPTIGIFTLRCYFRIVKHQCKIEDVSCQFNYEKINNFESISVNTNYI